LTVGWPGKAGAAADGRGRFSQEAQMHLDSVEDIAVERGQGRNGHRRQHQSVAHRRSSAMTSPRVRPSPRSICSMP
jgi:hypothetical protein